MTDNDYSQIVSLFFVAYAVMYAISGCVVDRLGTRLGMAFFVFVWSVAQILHGLAAGKWSFTACRFVLGLAEPGSFPAATKAIREWFPPEQRALGVGIFNAGSSLGAALAAPLAAYVAIHYGWRMAFVLTGGLGILWLALWLAFYRSPNNRQPLTPGTTVSVNENAGAPGASTGRDPVNWRGVLFSRTGYMLVLARFLTDPVIYFVIFWLPNYLEKERGFNLSMVGRYAWVPYMFGGIGYLIGGWLSARLAAAGRDISRARKIAMTIGAAIMPVAILAPLAPSWVLALAATCVIVTGHAIWIANLMTLPADLFPRHQVGTAAGFSGMGGAIGGALANWFTGSIIAHFSYFPIFFCAGLLHPLTVFLLWRFLPPAATSASQAAWECD